MIAVPQWRCRYVGSGGRSVVAAVFGGEAAPVMVSGEAACTCLAGNPLTWAMVLSHRRCLTANNWHRRIGGARSLYGLAHGGGSNGNEVI